MKPYTEISASTTALISLVFHLYVSSCQVQSLDKQQRSITYLLQTYPNAEQTVHAFFPFDIRAS